MQKSFTFDLNKCTGCGACQLACSIENERDTQLPWRSVHTYNEIHYPEIPCFHLSLACNHCVDPPCLLSCPALAYSKEKKSGAVLLDSQKCIGCRYCSWACPYDAPQYNPISGLMEKCNFCQPRLDQGWSPACVTLCPTSALRFKEFEENISDIPIPGFTKTDIKPAIKFIPLKKNQQTPQCSGSFFEDYYQEDSKSPVSKINLKTEWPLVIFTLLIALLASLYASNIQNPGWFNFWLLAGTGMGALGITTFHLGNKTRAYRSVLNWKKSWLSREIILIILFLCLSTANLNPVFSNQTLGWISIFTGVAALFAIDSVYIVTKTAKLYSHSAQVLFTGLLFFGLFSLNSSIFITIILLKLFFYGERKLRFKLTGINTRPLLSVLRFMFGFIVPAILWLINSQYFFNFIVFSVLAGEIIDRCEYYLELEIPSPNRQIVIDLEKELQNAKP